MRSATAPDPGLLERESELAAIAGAVEGARAGRGRLVVVRGVAGSGKSALLEAATRSGATAGLRVLSARGAELECELPFGAIRQLFAWPLATAAPAERARMLAGAAAPARAIVDPASGHRAEAGFGTLHALYWLTTHLSQTAPLLLVVDDLHWVDSPTLRALGHLALRIDDLPVVLAVTLRPSEPESPTELIAAITDVAGAVDIRLGPLTAASVDAIVRARLPAADAALRAACLEASAGNPYLLRELLVDAGPETTAAEIHRHSLPGLGDRLLGRIERLSPQAPRLAQAMAVLGDGGSLADAAAVAGIDERAASQAASRMTRVEILRRDDPFEFAHPLVRRSVYDALTVNERDETHRAAAQRLGATHSDPEVVASHLARLRPSRSLEIVDALRAAADAASARGAPDIATGLLRRALDEGTAGASRALVLSDLGRAELQVRDPHCAEHLAAALELSADPLVRGRVSHDLAVILTATGRWSELFGLVARAIDDLAHSGPGLTADLEALRAVAMCNHCEWADAYHRDRERLLGLTDDDSWGARALAGIIASHDLMAGRVEGSLALAEKAVADGRLLEERDTSAWPIPSALGAFVLLDQLDRAQVLIDRLGTLARRDGSLVGITTAIGLHAWTALRRGDLRRAEEEMRTGYELLSTHSSPLFLITLWWWLWEAAGERPGIDAMLAPAEELDLDESVLAASIGAFTFEARGRLALAQGRRADAVAHLRRAEPVMRGLRYGPVFSSWRSTLALALPPADRDDALALVAEELALAQASGLPRAHGVALRNAALARGGEEEIEMLRCSVALLERSPSTHEVARSQVALGSALRRRGHRSDAREALAAGLDLAERSGAEATASRGMEELRAAGARPRRRTLTGADSLTASEARVARLVAEGRSNAEVAQELYLSLKTIETHLSKAYAKLDVSGAGARRRLGGALARPVT